MNHESIAKLRKNTLLLVFLTIFLDLVGFGLFIPILANLARSFSATAAEAAALSTWYSVGTLIASFFLGRLSDRIGRKRILMITIAVSALAQLSTGFANSYGFLVACRFIAGMACGNIAVAQASIADITVPKERGRSMIIIGLAFGFGFAVGPALGGLITRFFPDHYLMAIGTTAFTLNLINLIAVQTRLPETNHNFPSEKIRAAIEEVKAAQAESNLEKRPFKVDLRKLLSTPGFKPLLAMQFIQMFGFVGVETIMPIALRDAYGLDDRKIFDLFTYMGLTIILTNGALARPLLKKIGEFKTLNIGQLLVTLAIAGIPFFAPEASIVTYVLIFMAVGSALFNPAITALVSRLAPSDVQGFALGVNQSLASGARILGPLCMGALYQTLYGVKSLYVSASFLIFAALFSIAGLWTIRKKFGLEQRS